MTNLSNLIVSISDLQRLEALLDTLPRERATAPQACSRHWSAPRSGFLMGAPPSQLCLTLVFPWDVNG